MFIFSTLVFFISFVLTTFVSANNKPLEYEQSYTTRRQTRGAV